MTKNMCEMLFKVMILIHRYGDDTHIQSELNKCISFLIDQTRTLSVTGLLQLLRKVCEAYLIFTVNILAYFTLEVNIFITL